MNTENINIEDIKIGETYNVRVKVHRTVSAGIVCHACDKDGHYLSKKPNIFTEDEVEAFSPVTPENGTKNSEHAPKYDPCRMLKEGDKVRVVERNGRFPYIGWKHILNQCYTVKADEDRYHKIILDMPEVYFYIDPAYLELVTPVEELEPYNVKFLQSGEIPDTYYYWAVMDNMGNEVARFWHEQYEKGQAKAAADAECARLNEAYRKENA